MMLMLKVMKYLKKFKLLLFIVFILTIIQTAVDLTLPAYMADIIDRGVIEGNLSHIYIVGLKMLFVTIVGGGATIALGFLASKISASVAENIRRDLFQKIESFSLTEFVRYGVSSLITRTTNDIQQIQVFLTLMIKIALLAPLIGIGSIIVIIGKNYDMSWIVIIALLIIGVLLLIVFAIAMPKLRKFQHLVDKINRITRENLVGIRVIRAFNNEEHQEHKFDKVNRELTRIQLFIERLISLFSPLLMLIMDIAMIAIIWIGASKIDMQDLQIGDMMAFLQYALQIMMAFLMLSIIFILYPRASVSARRIVEILNTDLTIKDKEKTIEPDNYIKGTIEFKNVSFLYPHAKENVLKDISFKINQGEKVAIIGSTGSGKSTLINLIPRFFDVTEGSVLVNDVDVRDYKQEILRSKISYSPQKAMLFKGTIEDNIRYGEKHPHKRDVAKYAKIAQIYDYIIDKDEKFNTQIAQDATNISGGQKQRISIARALMKQADIYIFDDSFSGLDYSTDKALREALNENLGDTTVLIIGQRINTVMHADKIIVLEKGRVVGMGTHQQLLKDCDVYKEIALSQLSEEELG
jgi:ATP-binding cassette, subfamily B, multidrug efflux pump